MDWPSLVCWPSLVWEELTGLAVVGLPLLDWPYRWVGSLDSPCWLPSLGWLGLVVGFAWIGRWVCLDWPSESVTCQTLGVRHVVLKSQFVINR